MPRTYSSDDVNRLIELRDRITKNIASLDDYTEYDKLLVKSGLWKQRQIDKKLIEYGFKSWNEYYQKRRQNKFQGHRSDTEGQVLGAILGLSLVILLATIYRNAR